MGPVPAVGEGNESSACLNRRRVAAAPPPGEGSPGGFPGPRAVSPQQARGTTALGRPSRGPGLALSGRGLTGLPG